MDMDALKAIVERGGLKAPSMAKYKAPLADRPTHEMVLVSNHNADLGDDPVEGKESRLWVCRSQNKQPAMEPSTLTKTIIQHISQPAN